MARMHVYSSPLAIRFTVWHLLNLFIQIFEYWKADTFEKYKKFKISYSKTALKSTIDFKFQVYFEVSEIFAAIQDNFTVVIYFIEILYNFNLGFYRKIYIFHTGEKLTFM